MKSAAGKFKLVSYTICPYVQRVCYALEDRGFEYERIYINPYVEKPDWFKELSPEGKVPVIVIDDKPIHESIVILELINNHIGGGLLPENASDQERARLLLKKVDAMHSLTGKMFVAGTEAEFETVAKKFVADLTETGSLLSEIYQNIEGNGLLEYTYAPVYFLGKLLTLMTQKQVFPEETGYGEIMASILTSDNFEKTITDSYAEDVVKFFALKKDSFLANKAKKVNISELQRQLTPRAMFTPQNM